jgi:formylglycine-generating enzyme required for sulfatase activity
LPTSSLPPTFKNSIGMEFVIVPKGKSWLGGGKDKLGDKEVEIPADFYLGKYEVTQEEWTQVMGANRSFFSRTRAKDRVNDVTDADLKRFPVEDVSWDQCQVFVAKLNQREKETGWVYRLPTEAEWEYACRGGPMADKADSAFDFYLAKPTNTLLPELANATQYGADQKGLNRTCRVGSYAPNELGLYDMHGNVAEWCEDAVAAGNAVHRVRRGGGWPNPYEDGKAAFRTAGLPTSNHNNLGLRLARVPSGAPSPEAKTPPDVVAPFTDADVQRIAALPAAEQVEEVRKELMRRNPGFDGKMVPKIEDGVVTEFRIVTDKVTDIAPIRVFDGLRVLECSGTYTEKPNGLLADLKSLREMNLAGLIYLNLATTTVSDAGLIPFKDCKALTHVDLPGRRVSDAGLTRFKDCKALTFLNLEGTQVGDAGLAHFKGTSLKSLWIDDTGITDLTPLQGMPLEDIRLSPKNITQGLDILRAMKSLKTIGIHWDQFWPAAEFWDRYDKGEFKE